MTPTAPVCLIDENRHDLFALELRLQQLKGLPGGLTSFTCLKDALEWGKSNRPSLIISALNLPDSSGLGTLGQLQRAFAKTPIIVLTAADDEAAHQAKQHGAQDLLIKGSYNLESLTCSVRNALGGAAATTKLQNESTNVISEALDSSSKAAKSVESNDQSLQGLCLLIAEDYPVNQLVLRHFLEKQGATVVAVANGQEAVEAVQQQPFDAVLMDIQMPLMDGLQATKAIRALNGPVHLVPIIALTANVTQKEVSRCLDSGMNGCVTKQLDFAELTDTLLPSIAGARAVISSVSSEADTPLLHYLLTSLDAGEALVNSVTQEFLAQVPGDVLKLRAALAMGHHDLAAKLAHKLANPLSIVGMRDLSHHMVSIQAAIETSDSNAIHAHMQQFDALFPKKLVQLEQEVANLNCTTS